MLKSIKELYSLLNKEQRSKLLVMQVLVVFMSFSELAGVVSVGPFMALVGDMSRLEGDSLWAEIYRASGASSPTDFIFWFGVGVLLLLSLTTLISIFATWQLEMFGHRVGAELSSRLFKHYMYQPWLFHANGSSSQLSKQIAQECQRVTVSVIIPLMNMNANAVMASLMATVLFVYDPLVATVGLLIFTTAYLLLYRTVRRRLINNGTTVSDTQALRFKLMAEGFGGIKDALLLGRQRVFTERFEKVSQRFANAQGTTLAMSQVPRFAMELVAFGAVIFLVLYLLAAHQGNLGTILPVLSVYALAGFKLLPAFQQIYSSVSRVRGNLAAFESMRDDLHASVVSSVVQERADPEKAGRWVPRQSIEFRDVHFTYPGKQASAVAGLSLKITANQVIGLVGASGSGKSTAIDLLLGLIDPVSGQVLIDGEPLTAINKRAWQNSLGLVPQSIFLSDTSIRENIAFGLPPSDIDDARVERAASLANLDELISQLPEGLETDVGERGVQLSGGQRQRIGIARALYHDADVLVLDEATSALDGITEQLVMDAIHEFSGTKTIVLIAHRLATVKQCDCIYLMKDGRVIDQGRFEDLVIRNDTFKRMAERA
ncbi:MULTISPECIES: ABC transporter ATP-binding protein [Halomonadaceae]|uniref:ABC transporter ATP-binding protein n=1 Tax=Halomonadaceae TaxID=28256 RepID=UPI0015842873|nr:MULTISPECIES: ABC transporter ATP-binding protein [Halomonas]MDI4635984.1 ABC transporter ATP-binding protein/permease [Halomonas sp. BMC7]NUJ60349.1 ABC transporter ATP-binding protein [Halomonas taeanensis]